MVVPGGKLLPGQVRDIIHIPALIEQNGGIVRRYGILPDQAEDWQPAGMPG
jgi:molybdopterin biosynthesis enzyme